MSIDADIISWIIVGLLAVGGLWIFFPVGGRLPGYSNQPSEGSLAVILPLRLLSWVCLAGRAFGAILVMRAVSRTPDATNLWLFGASVLVYLIYRFRIEFTHSSYGEFKF